MRVLLQRVNRAGVVVEGKEVASIGRGFLLLVGIGREDTPEDAAWLAHRVARLRVFEDEAGKMNLALHQVKGEVLVVSQFTLYADCRHGNRPSFTLAAPPAEAEALYQCFVAYLREEGLPVATGVFGAKMQVYLENDGPVTLWLESPLRQKRNGQDGRERMNAYGD